MKVPANQKIHFVTGKGGVGKSLIAAGLAKYLAELSVASGHAPVLLAELNDRSFFKDFLNIPKVTYTPHKWLPNLEVSLWSSTDCLREYALHLLKVESLYKLFFENPISKALINVAPGLPELAILGKATSGVRQHGPALNYQQIVMDSFSSGHFLSLFRAPRGMAETISFGPMAEQSRSIDHWIRNPDFTFVHLVTLAEELPITETLELAEQIHSEFGLKPRIYLNKIFDLKAADVSKLTLETKKYFSEQIELQNKARHKLEKSGFDFYEIPLITSLDSEELVQIVSERFLDVKP